jgi:hypothetical protein
MPAKTNGYSIKPALDHCHFSNFEILSGRRNPEDSALDDEFLDHDCDA